MVRHAVCLALCAAIPTAACGTSTGPDDIGEARAEITQVPNDVLCVQIVVTGGGHTAVRQFDVTPGASSVLSLKSLPLGPDVFEGSAFAQSCSTVTGSTTPTWVGSDVAATLSPGVVAEVKLVLTRNGQASVSVDFQGDDGGGLTCPPGRTACNGICVDTSTDPNNCGGCGVVCTAPDTCGGAGTPGVCGCQDDGTACANRVCGSTTNNCGQVVSCGTCSNGGRCCTDQCVCSTCVCP